MPKYRFQQLSDTNAAYTRELNEAAARVIASGRYLLGPETEAFEQELAALLHTGYAVGTANGLEAIRLIFRALIETGRLRPGDGVLVPANTFIASILPLTQLGLVPQPVDPDEATMSVSLSKMADATTSETKAALAVHLYGYPAYDTEGLRRLTDRGIMLVEDNAQAIGAEVWDETAGIWRRTGSLGIASATSFYPAKNIGALGDAGAAATSDRELADVIRELSNYGSSRKYHYEYRGYNSRMDELQAAFLRVKLPYTDAERQKRDIAAMTYAKGITNPQITLPPTDNRFRQAWHQYVIRSPRRDELQRYLAENGVETMIHYPVPPHLQPCYRGIFDGAYPVTERLAGEVLSLPIANTGESEASEIAEIINRFK